MPVICARRFPSVYMSPFARLHLGLTCVLELLLHEDGLRDFEHRGDRDGTGTP